MEQVNQYSVEFKKAVVKKFLTRGNRMVKDVAADVGISIPTLYHWKEQFAINADMKKTTKPHSRSVQEKLQAIYEYSILTEDEQGEFLRSHGLQEAHIQQWREQVTEALGNGKLAKDKKELIAEKNKNLKLEKELKRKDKALAEASALLILKKKADLIWGDPEDE